MRLASHVLCVKNVVFKGQGFVVWIDLPAIDTCILVEIDLQVYIVSRKAGFTRPKVYFFPYFAVCWMGRVSQVGTRRFSWWRELCVFLLGNAIPSNLAILELQFSFNGTIVCCKNLPISLFLSFFGKVSNISYIFFTCVFVFEWRENFASLSCLLPGRFYG